jgi:hypothetical protein
MYNRLNTICEKALSRGKTCLPYTIRNYEKNWQSVPLPARMGVLSLHPCGPERRQCGCENFLHLLISYMEKSAVSRLKSSV